MSDVDDRQVAESGYPDPQEERYGLVNQVLNETYRIDRYEAKGGFGDVYRAWQLTVGRTVAIKCVAVADDVESPEHAGRPGDEAWISAQLHPAHPSFVTVFDQGVITAPSGKRLLFVAMEWIDGFTLGSLLDYGHRFSESAAIERLRPAIEGIGVAHARQPAIVHRDLKPHNLFIPKDKQKPIRVLDLGAAKVLHQTSGICSTHAPRTPAYAAPEQLVPQYEIGPWTDVYAFGTILEEMVLGRADFESLPVGDCASRCERRDDVSAGFKAVCRKALARAPEGRYRNATELLQALDALVNVESVAAPLLPQPAEQRTPAQSPQPALSEPAAPAPPDPPPQSHADTPSERSRRVRTGAVALVLTTLTGALTVYALHSARVQSDAASPKRARAQPRTEVVRAVLEAKPDPEHSKVVVSLDAGRPPVTLYEESTAARAGSILSTLSESHGPPSRAGRRASLVPPVRRPSKEVLDANEVREAAARLAESEKQLASCAEFQTPLVRRNCKAKKGSKLKERQEEYDLAVKIAARSAAAR